MYSYLDELEAKSIYIFREAYSLVKLMAAMWSVGKDSTAMLWLARKAFLGRVPFPVCLLDTGMEMDEVYNMRDRLIDDWQLDCINQPCPPENDLDQDLPPNARAAMRKTEGLKNLMREQGFQGIACGIRRDEQGLRAKERVFSPRDANGKWDFKNQPPELWDQYNTQIPEGGHLRIHPLLHWTELDIWRYHLREGIEFCPLYLAREDKETGKMMRYRSLGEKNITFPVPSNASSIEEIIAELETSKISERAGRSIDTETEDSFERLREKGYM